MKITQGIFAISLLTGISVQAETDNFNVSLTGTFDNTVPDDCTVTPMPPVDVGTLMLHDIHTNVPTEISPDSLYDVHDIGIEITVTINCTIGTNYSFEQDFSPGIFTTVVGSSVWMLKNSDGIAGAGYTSIGTGSDQAFTFDVFLGETSYDIRNLTGTISTTLPMTLTVL